MEVFLKVFCWLNLMILITILYQYVYFKNDVVKSDESKNTFHIIYNHVNECRNMRIVMIIIL